jgi:hypothetical protein
MVQHAYDALSPSEGMMLNRALPVTVTGPERLAPGPEGGTEGP